MPGTGSSVSDLVVRPFLRSDRDQVTALANAHVAAVIPGSSISVSELLSNLEQERGEVLENPWVIERVTLVAEHRHAIVAAAHLQRFSGTPDTPDGMRNIGGIRWLVCRPTATSQPSPDPAGTALLNACLAVLRRWNLRVIFADGALPVPGVYGIPDQWPHIRSLLTAAGFTSAGRSERIMMGRVSDLPDPRRHDAPRGFSIQRTLGLVGTRLTAVDGHGLEVGMIELGTTLDASSQRSRHEGLADIGNLHMEKGYVKNVGGWLMSQARQWLELGGVTRVLAYIAVSEDAAELAQQEFLRSHGFHIITTTVRDLSLRPQGG